MKKYHISLFIGRFEPFHQGHYHVVKKALEVSEKLVFLVGSANRARSIRNPFSFDERKKMIQADLKGQGVSLDQIIFEPINDFYYNEEAWIDAVKSAVLKNTSSNDRIVLVGHNKDSSSYYLDLFPNWAYLEVDNYNGFNATEFREDYFGDGILRKGYLVEGLTGYLIGSTYEFLMRFKETEHYQHLKDEYRYVTDYKNAWKNTPYPVIFTTCDAIVICQNHLLVIERGGQPGHGLLALPGGFLEANERIKNGILRELKEETNLLISKAQIAEIRTFDHPERSLLGRVITHGGIVYLKDKTLPKVYAEDDAKKAYWLELSKVKAMPNCFFDDHFQIIQSFLNDF